eukprot:362159-Chlamydomonas_euryale.AAC.13
MLPCARKSVWASVSESEHAKRKPIHAQGSANKVQRRFEAAEVDRLERLMEVSPWLRLWDSPVQTATIAWLTRPRRALVRTLGAPLLSHAAGICERMAGTGRQDGAHAWFKRRWRRALTGRHWEAGWCAYVVEALVVHVREVHDQCEGGPWQWGFGDTLAVLSSVVQKEGRTV